MAKHILQSRVARNTKKIQKIQKPKFAISINFINKLYKIILLFIIELYCKTSYKII